MRGHRHPHWPATVLQKIKITSKSKVQCEKFEVKFFGTNQTAVVPASEIVAFNENSLEKYDTKKNRKFRHFKDALEQINENQLELELCRTTNMYGHLLWPILDSALYYVD